ncbi:hypothetical protein BJ138DRAFT_1160570 [Hygrophoropsis aurantiaca]|uniref:Uncharacterized protein n=1 Tax=Hygrophoropsis aurantiaca TaxID=72124 RepID=A0ACB8A2Q9_9AGAM|nr:hypothetical protein BJ138DRAFT_1160570 [Hygrophoropsis aurantiaca]
MSVCAHVDQDQDELAETCRTMQLEEWQVLESIFPDCCVSSDITQGNVRLEVSIELGYTRSIAVVDDGSIRPSSSATHGSEIRDELSSLPPLLLTLRLPHDYPLHAPPEIVSLQVTHSWLPQPRIKTLQEHLSGMWQPGEGVLYPWVEYIRSGDFLETLGMCDDPSVIRIPHPAPHLLAPLLKAHHTAAQSSTFAQTSYTCAICLAPHKGAACLQLIGCAHVFCRACLADFWGLCIAEGDVARVGCPDPECVRDREREQAEGSEGLGAGEVGEEEVRRVLGEEDIVRWRWLKQKRALERDPSMVHCPMEFCQTPVPKPPSDGDDESGWARLRTCPSCEYSFCAFCKRTWHGPLSDCPLSATESFVREYLALPASSPARATIERRFGRATVARLVAAYEEEQANRKWLDASTMRCPGCEVKVEKSVGCNHMTCAKCKQHFCYRCGEKIQASNPYAHFSTPGLRCFSKLFDFDPSGEGAGAGAGEGRGAWAGDDEWQPVELFEFVQ